jgi:phage-related protein
MGSDRPLVWLHGQVKSPPLSSAARRWTGFLLRQLQQGLLLGMPDSRPMPSIGARCHELRIKDTEKRKEWRIVYRIDDDAIVIGEVFAKKTRTTPKQVLDACRKRFREYDSITG